MRTRVYPGFFLGEGAYEKDIKKFINIDLRFYELEKKFSGVGANPLDKALSSTILCICLTSSSREVQDVYPTN